MNASFDADRTILEWLAADRGRVDEAGVSVAIASTRDLPQRRGFLGRVGGVRPWPTSGWGAFRPSRAAILVAAVALGLAITGALLVGNQVHLPLPQASASPSTTADRTPDAPSVAPSPAAATIPPLEGPFVVTTETATWSLGLGNDAARVSRVGCVSPDGASTAYLRSAPSGGENYDLVIANADGSAPHVAWSGAFVLSNGPSQMFWSPNSEFVAQSKARVPNGNLVIAQRSTGAAFGAHLGGHEFPGETAFSPDGRQLATMTGTGIGLYDARGSDIRTIATAPNIRTIAWSPDGTTIAYVAATSPDRVGGGVGDLYFVGIDGSPARLIDGGDESYYAVAWSPDGSYLAVTNDTGPTVVFDRAGAEQFRFDNPGEYVSWSPDSRYVLGGLSQNSTKATVVDVETQDATEIAWPQPRPFLACPQVWLPMIGGGN